jgi:hypothetical protein
MREMEEELREIRYYAVYGEHRGFILKSILERMKMKTERMNLRIS